MHDVHGEDIRRERSIAGEIVDALGMPLLVLRQDLCVVDANRAFCGVFQVDRPAIQGKPVTLLGNGEWNTAELRQTLGLVVPQLATLDSGNGIRRRVGIGRRRMLLDARALPAGAGQEPMILLAFDDLAGSRARQAKLQTLLDQKEIQVQEMAHRIFNSLAIIGAFLSMKARVADHDETRRTLHEVHGRIMSIAAVQRLLQDAPGRRAIGLGPYLSELCDNLSTVMTGVGPKIAFHVRVGEATIDSVEAVPIGLIVTELVTNAIKHAFPDTAKNCSVLITHKKTAAGWRLRFSDNGIGQPADVAHDRKGLGTTIVTTLARQLNADVKITVNDGRTITVQFPSTAAGRAPVLDSSAPAAWARRSFPRPDMPAGETSGRAAIKRSNGDGQSNSANGGHSTLKS